MAIELAVSMGNMLLRLFDRNAAALTDSSLSYALLLILLKNGEDTKAKDSGGEREWMLQVCEAFKTTKGCPGIGT